MLLTTFEPFLENSKKEAIEGSCEFRAVRVWRLHRCQDQLGLVGDCEII